MRICLGVLLCLLATFGHALEVGERLAPWTLLDQYEKPYSFDDRLQVLLVARSMAGGELVKAALKGSSGGYLEARRAVFVADISRMPSLVASLFAIPAMRGYTYRVLLDRESRVTSRYPGDESRVLWLRLDRGRLMERKEFGDAAALRAALESLAP